MSRQGWLVYVCDQDEDAEDFRRCSEQIQALQHSPAMSAAAMQFSRFYHAVKADLNARGLAGIDLLVNNAGIAGPTARLEDQPVDAWLRTIDININGTFHMTREALPLLRCQAPGASIIKIESRCGLFRCPLRGPYVAGKRAGDRPYQDTGNGTWTPKGSGSTRSVRAVSKAPGSIGSVAADVPDPETCPIAEVEAEYRTAEHPCAPLLTCDDIANMVIYLTSPAGQRDFRPGAFDRWTYGRDFRLELEV